MSASIPALRVGVIGCGFFAQNHLHAWRDMPEVDVRAVCDVEASRARAAAEDFGAQAWYDDAETMLREVEFDVVDVATTPPSHRALVEMVAEHGVAVICQKPMAADFADAEAMVAACKRARVPFMVHENFRWQRPLRAMRRYLDSNAIGRPFFGRVTWRTGFDIFAKQPYLAAEQRLIVADLGVHMLDLARFLFGEPATLQCQTSRVRPDIKGEDAATILLGYPNASCVLDFTYSAHLADDYFPQTLVHIEGDAGTLDLEPNYRLTLARAGQPLQHETIEIPQRAWFAPPWDIVQDSVVNTQHHFVVCLRDRETAETSGHDNLRTLELVEGAYHSAETGSVYRPSPAMQAVKTSTSSG